MIISARPEVGITSLQSKRIEAGATVRLMCVLMQGDPPVKFHWMKEARPVETISGVKVTAEEFASSILISRANEVHTGNYTCVAANPTGYSFMTTEILVNGN